MPLQVTTIGHATTLIQWDGLNILTDPVFSSRVLFFKRRQPLPFNPASLPKLDAILISHAHYDHLDLFSFKYIPSDVPIFIPQGMSKAIAPHVKNRIIELSPWSRFSLRDGLEIRAVPAKHPGGRLSMFLPVFCCYRLCLGYVLSLNKENIYFAGDTSYGDHFSRIGSLFPLKLALLPITHKKNNFLSRYWHLDIPDFLKGWEDLGSPPLIPIHWGTFFRRGCDKEFLKTALEKLGDKLHLLTPGEGCSF